LGGEEETGCIVARMIAVVLFAVGTIAFLLGFCFPALAPYIFYVAAGLGIAAIIVLIIWAIVCPTKPCGWGWLLIGQVLICVGWVAVYFWNCCAWLGVAGIAFLLLGIGALAIWAVLCRIGMCRVLREAAIPLTVVALPLIGYILLFPPAAACAISLVGAILATAYAILTTAALSCKGP
jgi:hypothetical protein